MKKATILMFAFSSFCAVALTACGPKFTPLTPEQISAQVDSLFNAQKDAKLTELRAACQTGLQAAVDAKVEALKSQEEASK